jgi:predicted aldo/keto reductase-like oxidoreductase
LTFFKPQLTQLNSRRYYKMVVQLKLNTGAQIPAIGFGTWQDKDSQEEAVTHALEAGYRHIDTARIYGTEPAVGKALKVSVALYVGSQDSAAFNARVEEIVN